MSDGPVITITVEIPETVSQLPPGDDDQEFEICLLINGRQLRPNLVATSRRLNGFVDMLDHMRSFFPVSYDS